MSGSFETPITIENALQMIDERKLLLPAIQRNFVWSSSQICVLFDSIMQGYPINTFMFWDVKDNNIKKKFKFYDFLRNYTERFEENNPDFNTKNHADFLAVIDGQQRLTSLYIALKGSYAYKLPRKWWPKINDENILPKRKLYLNLKEGINEDTDDERMKYEFNFLTEEDLRNEQSKIWFEVGEILCRDEFKNYNTEDEIIDIVTDYLERHDIIGNKYARTVLCKLYHCIRKTPLIYYYKECLQDIDHVLDVFIRTNHGGTSLTFSDLLMSITIANWESDIRKQIEEIVSNVRFSSDMGFSIDKDFILKTSLMITNNDVKFQVKNFSQDTVKLIEKDWGEIKNCIIEVFKLLNSLGFNDLSLRAKNSAIPIAYYLFHKGRNVEKSKKGIYTDINNKTRYIKEKQIISKWLHSSLLKGVFGGQGDQLLSSLRNIIKNNLINSNEFPIEKIKDSYKGSNKDITFDNDFLDRILKTQKQDTMCFSILALLYPDYDFSKSFDIDHLHPEDSFKKKNLDKQNFLINNQSKRSFYENSENWNSIVNLQILDSSVNRSKNKKALLEWAKEFNINNDELFVSSDIDLSFENFENFVNDRIINLKEKFKRLL